MNVKKLNQYYSNRSRAIEDDRLRSGHKGTIVQTQSHHARNGSIYDDHRESGSKSYLTYKKGRESGDIDRSLASTPITYEKVTMQHSSYATATGAKRKHTSKEVDALTNNFKRYLKLKQNALSAAAQANGSPPAAKTHQAKRRRQDYIDSSSSDDGAITYESGSTAQRRSEYARHCGREKASSIYERVGGGKPTNTKASFVASTSTAVSSSMDNRYAGRAQPRRGSTGAYDREDHGGRGDGAMPSNCKELVKGKAHLVPFGLTRCGVFEGRQGFLLRGEAGPLRAALRQAVQRGFALFVRGLQH